MVSFNKDSRTVSRYLARTESDDHPYRKRGWKRRHGSSSLDLGTVHSWGKSIAFPETINNSGVVANPGGALFRTSTRYGVSSPFALMTRRIECYTAAAASIHSPWLSAGEALKGEIEPKWHVAGMFGRLPA